VHHGRGKWRNAIHGLAYIGGTTADIYLPARCCTDVDKIQLCRVMAHEFAHLRGLSNERRMRHREDGWIGHDREGARRIYAWAEALPLERKTIRAPRSPAVQAENKRQRAMQSLATWTRKLRLAQTKRTKYLRQVAYYTKRLVRTQAASPALARAESATKSAASVASATKGDDT
jgi:hypothetical protein